jgi:hypothetical protein
MFFLFVHEPRFPVGTKYPGEFYPIDDGQRKILGRFDLFLYVECYWMLDLVEYCDTL